MTDADLERNGYIYTVTGPDGVVYNTLAEAMAANQTFDTTSNGASQTDSSPQMFTVNYEQDPVSLSTSESISGSESLSESIVTSTSESESVSLLNQFQKVTHYQNRSLLVIQNQFLHQLVRLFQYQIQRATQCHCLFQKVNLT